MSSDDNDKSSERVLEYYQKYSQNRNLPKYFSGTSVAYLPPIEVDSDDNSKYILKSSPEIPKITVTVESKYVERQIALTDNSPNASSSEGPSDHKKLEWDNGADIGYHSARKHHDKKLRKSASLPIIGKVICDEIIAQEKPSTVITHHGSKEDIDLIVYSSGSSTKSDSESKKSPVLSDTPSEVAESPKSSSSESSCALEPPKYKTSSRSDSDVSKFVEFQSSIDYLKKKIGLPGAQSTPNIIQLHLGKITSSKTSLAALLLRGDSEASSSSGKPSVPLQSKASDTSIMPKPSEESSNITQETSSASSKLQTKNPKQTYQTKFVELSISTPINVNCRGPTVCSQDKILQTENVATPKAVQTDNLTPESQTSTKTNKKDQEAQYSLYGEADLASSFEYINISEQDNIKKSSQEDPYYTPSASKQCATSKKSSSVSGVLKEVTLSTTADSSNLSKSSSEEIDKQIEKLQRLLKTKKAGHSTKKKLMKLIGDMDTSVESSASSDLFVPKKDKATQQKLKAKVVFKEADNLISDYKERQSMKASTSSEHKSSEAKFHQSQSTLTGRSRSSESSKPESPEGSKEASEQIDGQVSSHIKARKASKILDRSQGDGLHVSHIKDHIKYSNNQIVQTVTTKSESIQPSSSKEGTSSSSGRSHSVASLSRKPSEDYLLRFAENERNYQLNWIKNEIGHLSKLKSILELKSDRSIITSAPSQQQTNIYSVIRKDSVSKKSSERNYVIQTQVQSGTRQPINYRLAGQEFRVSDHRSSPDSDRAIMADIEVSSDEKNTNIKVRTFCSACKHSICVCSPSKKTINSKISSLTSESVERRKSSDEDSNSKGKELSGSQELRPCKKCTKPICCCAADDCKASSSSKSSDTASFLECISDTEDTVSDEYINSLQKAFKECCCTVKNANCGCNFVKKLIKKFQEQHKIKGDVEVQTTQQPAELTVNSFEVAIPPVEIVEIQAQTESLNLAAKVQTDPAPVAEDVAMETNKEPTKHCPTQAHQNVQTSEKVLKETPVQVASSLSQHTEIQVSISPVSQKIEQQQTDEPQIRDQAAEARNPVRDAPSQINPVQKAQKVQTSQRMSISDAVAQAHVESVNAATRMKTTLDGEVCLNVEDLEPVESLLAGQARGTMTELRVANASTSRTDAHRRHVGVQVFPSFETSASQSETVRIQSKMLGAMSSSKLKDKKVEAKEGSKEIGVQYQEASRQELGAVSSFNLKDKRVEAKEGSKEIGVQYQEASRQELGAISSFNLKDKRVEAKDIGIQYDSASKEASLSRSSNVKTSPNTTTSTSGSTSTSCIRVTCPGCKQKAFLAEVNYIQEGNESLAVCSRCYFEKTRAQSAVNHYCHCWNHWTSRTYCRCCRVEVSKCLRRPQGTMYTVTLEEKTRRRSSKGSMDNIKVHRGWSRKSLKNKENYHKKGSERRNGLQEVDDEKDKDEKEVERERKKSRKSSRDKNGYSHYTLMEYLIRNRPEFVYSAEYRRQMLLNSRILREQQKDGAKLHFLENNLKDNDRDQFRLFTEKEMKEINKKNYQKLPEVQEKLWNQRENKLRTADRLITNMFAKKVQTSILKGKVNHPIDKPLTSL